jgi:hypothetical protein
VLCFKNCVSDWLYSYFQLEVGWVGFLWYPCIEMNRTSKERRALAELSRRVAMAGPSAALIEARKIVHNLGPDDREITSRLSIPEILAIGHAASRKSRPGRPSKEDVFREAAQLRSDGLSFTAIAQRLDPVAWAKNPRRSAEKFRKGVSRLNSPQ